MVRSSRDLFLSAAVFALYVGSKWSGTAERARTLFDVLLSITWAVKPRAPLFTNTWHSVSDWPILELWLSLSEWFCKRTQFTTALTDHLLWVWWIIFGRKKSTFPGATTHQSGLTQWSGECWKLFNTTSQVCEIVCWNVCAESPQNTMRRFYTEWNGNDLI